MSKLLRAAALTGVIASAVYAQAPAPVSVLSTASETLPGLPNAAIAEGSIFVVYGKNMGPATLAQPTALSLPTSTGLAGTVVSVTVGGVTAACPMIYTLAGQVSAVLPSNIPPGTGTLTVTYNGASGSTPITVVASNFSMYTINGSGTGPAVVTFADYSVVSVTNSAAPGDEIVLWGTGLGPLPAGASDAIVPTQVNLTTPIQVYVGGIQVNVLYHGRSAAAGLDQINFTIPAGLSGCYVPVIVQTTTSLVSNTATMSIAAKHGGTCSDSNGLPLSSITPSANGTVSLGFISLSQTTSSLPSIAGLPASTTTSSSGSASFYQFTQQQLISTGSIFNQPSIGGCAVNLYNLGSSSYPTFTATGLNAGNAISVTGPANMTLTSTASAPGVYSASLQSALPAGTYTATVPGGSNVGAFTTTLNLPTALVWTNQASISTITRSAGQTITWTGGGSNSYVQILGISATGTTSGSVAEFICIAPVTAGSFTIPAAVLLSLPVSASISGFPTGVLEVGNYTNPVQITPTPSGLNYAFTSSGSSSSALVAYQ